MRSSRAAITCCVEQGSSQGSYLAISTLHIGVCFFFLACHHNILPLDIAVQILVVQTCAWNARDEAMGWLPGVNIAGPLVAIVVAFDALHGVFKSM